MDSRSGGIEEIKELMHQYNRAQLAAAEAMTIRRRLIPLLKQHNLTGTKFNFGDRVISYHNYSTPEGLTQKLLTEVLEERRDRGLVAGGQDGEERA